MANFHGRVGRRKPLVGEATKAAVVPGGIEQSSVGAFPTLREITVDPGNSSGADMRRMPVATRATYGDGNDRRRGSGPDGYAAERNRTFVAAAATEVGLCMVCGNRLLSDAYEGCRMRAWCPKCLILG